MYFDNKVGIDIGKISSISNRNIDIVLHYYSVSTATYDSLT